MSLNNIFILYKIKQKKLFFLTEKRYKENIILYTIFKKLHFLFLYLLDLMISLISLSIRK